MTSDEQQLALLPDDPPAYGGPAAAAVEPIRTQGRTEYAVHCNGPGGCGSMHRHVLPGLRTGPCGAAYTVPGPGEPPETDTS